MYYIIYAYACTYCHNYIFQSTFAIHLALPIRLVDGDIFPFSGRIEIYNNGKWGTVCGKKWTQINTQVVCRQLGYEAPFLSTDLNVPAGTGPILMANVMCKNNHSNLLECSHDGFGNHDCKHVHDVGVKCWSQKHRKLGFHYLCTIYGLFQ